MQHSGQIRRVVLVVLDGLRPDAIDRFDLVNTRRLARMGASTMSARTVTPSLTWPAITSLLTGIAPNEHGILRDSVHLPRPKTRLFPLPDLLSLAGYPCSAFHAEIPPLYRGVASRIASSLGFAEARFAGVDAKSVVFSARPTVRTQLRGLVFFHLADADRVGHQFGWMSEQYGQAAKHVDDALGLLAAELDIERDPSTLLIALADHGGGGLVANDHDGEHHLNETIPLVLAGGAVRQTSLAPAGLLDVPPTIAWALGVGTPAYRGRVLLEAFAGDSARVA